MIVATIVRVHQHAAGAKGGLKQAIGRSRGGLTTKIHTVVDEPHLICLIPVGTRAMHRGQPSSIAARPNAL